MTPPVDLDLNPPAGSADELLGPCAPQLEQLLEDFRGLSDDQLTALAEAGNRGKERAMALYLALTLNGEHDWHSILSWAERIFLKAVFVRLPEDDPRRELVADVMCNVSLAVISSHPGALDQERGSLEDARALAAPWTRAGMVVGVLRPGP